MKHLFLPSVALPLPPARCPLHCCAALQTHPCSSVHSSLAFHCHSTATAPATATATAHPSFTTPAMDPDIALAQGTTLVPQLASPPWPLTLPQPRNHPLLSLPLPLAPHSCS